MANWESRFPSLRGMSLKHVRPYCADIDNFKGQGLKIVVQPFAFKSYVAGWKAGVFDLSVFNQLPQLCLAETAICTSLSKSEPLLWLGRWRWCQRMH